VIGLFTTIFFAGIMVSISQLLLFGFKNINVSTGSIILSLEIVFAALIGYVTFGETLSIPEVIATGLILLASALAAYETKSSSKISNNA
jgi:drug/metabolite transporter (DMT)-like permease